MKKILLTFIILLFIVNTVNAITVNCGRPVIINETATGDYVFPNTDNSSVLVTINNKFTVVSVIPNNTFTLDINESKTISFRAYTNMFIRLLVTYTDLSSGFSSSLECPFFIMSENPTTIPTTTTSLSTTTTISDTTTTTIPVSCSNLDFLYCSMQSNCRWVGDFRFGRCTSLTTTTTTISPTTTVETTSTIETTTTIPQTTTTIQSSCSGKSYLQCISTPGCRWIGNTITGYCESIPQTTTTISSTTRTVSTTTTIQQNTTTTTICPSVCIRWLRPFICLEWSNNCAF